MDYYYSIPSQIAAALAALLIAVFGAIAPERPQGPADYIGEYVDEDGGRLVIAPDDGDSFTVQMSIYRLASLDDGVGQLIETKLVFVATDPAGNLLLAVVDREGEDAVVTFVHSSWEYIKAGDSFRYRRSADAD